MRIFYLVLTLMTAVISCGLHAQKTNYVGLNFTVETASGAFNPGGGLLFERRMTKRYSLETGIYYRSYRQAGYVTFTSGTGSSVNYFIVSERYLSIPILYKLHTRVVNVSAGPTFDFFVGWKQKSSSIKVSDYSISPNFSIGLMAKASKDFNLNKHIILAPEVRFNHIITYGRTYIGFGIAAKQQL